MTARSPSHLLAALALCCALATALALALPSLGHGDENSPELRPDLVQRLPSDVGVRQENGRVELGFEAAVDNQGDGPLRVSGHRRGAIGDMTADQIVRRADGSHARARGIGKLRYTEAETHEHWHYLRFDVYELRSVTDHSLVRPDQKTGFCLGDRYDVGRDFPNKPRNAPFRGVNCLYDRPEALSVGMGISVGYGDNYRSYLEGQSIDVTGLANGQYVLVNRVNPGRRLRETRYANNRSSVRIRLSGLGEHPSVQVLERCPGTEYCSP